MESTDIRTGNCPLGGDTTNDCADCAYAGDYHMVDGECARREDETTEKRTMNERYEAIFERLGWHTVTGDDGSIDLEKYSPAGEDFIFSIAGEDIPAEVWEYANDFDAEEHAEMWVRNRGATRGVPDIRTLVKDADDIQEMLYELALALREEENNGTLDDGRTARGG